MITTVIVEDEPLVRQKVRWLLDQHEDFQIVAECGDGKAAIDTIKSVGPDVVFLDIKLPVLNGFDVLANLGEHMPLVVVLTAYDDFAVQAFEQQAIDYLLKPIAQSRFVDTLDRLRQRLCQNEVYDASSVVSGLLSNSTLSRIAVHDGQYMRLLETTQIELIESDGNYVNVFVGNVKYRLRHTLKSLATKLDPENFLRINRSALVNLTKVVKFERFEGGEYTLHMESGASIVSSRNYSSKLRMILSNQ